MEKMNDLHIRIAEVLIECVRQQQTFKFFRKRCTPNGRQLPRYGSDRVLCCRWSLDGSFSGQQKACSLKITSG